jgi:hypothetical protein
MNKLRVLDTRSLHIHTPVPGTPEYGVGVLRVLLLSICLKSSTLEYSVLQSRTQVW